MIESEQLKVNSDICYRYRHYQLAKAHWKMVEKEWGDWLASSDYKLSINEHDILIILMSGKEMAITKIAELGTMHISTVLNFSKKLEKHGLVELNKSRLDKRVTNVSITKKGLRVVTKIEKNWDCQQSSLINIAGNFENVIGSKPEFADLVQVLRVHYGNEVLDMILADATYQSLVH